MTCSCGKTAIYRVGTLGFCSTHRGLAVSLQAISRKTPKVYIPDGHRDMAAGGGTRKRQRPDKPADKKRRTLLINARTDAEIVLRAALDNHPLTRKRYVFQARIAGFHADFANPTDKVVVEADGWHHTTPKGRQMDWIREREFAKNGYRTIRFFNRAILDNTLEVLEAIADFQSGKTPAIGYTREFTVDLSANSPQY